MEEKASSKRFTQTGLQMLEDKRDGRGDVTDPFILVKQKSVEMSFLSLPKTHITQ
jgi:hypothetical protein